MKLCLNFGLLLLTVVLQLVTYASGKASIRLTRKLLKNGFHRHLHTQLMYQDGRLKSGCQLLLVEQLPSGCYVDVYEINQMKAFGGPQIWIENTPDTESPEHLSEPLLVHVYVQMMTERKLSTVDLPIHFRYHRPASGGISYESVNIPHPKLYRTCSDEHYKVDAGLKKPCNSSTSAECAWSEVVYFIEGDMLSATIPVGNKSHEFVVTLITCVTTTVGCFWLLLAVFKKL